MDWIESSKEVFAESKPINFGNYKHCSECKEYNERLKNRDVNSLTSNDLPEGDDPFFFCSDEGIKYYLPALIRFCFETDHFFFERLLGYLEKDGKNNSLVLSCSEEQRNYISQFVSFFIEQHSDEIERNGCDYKVLTVYDIWSSD